MATDTARIQLELASGRNEDTAPFHQTAQRRRKQRERDAASVDAPAEEAPASLVAIGGPTWTAAPPYDAPVAQPQERKRAPDSAFPYWIALLVAMVVVAGAVWWVMLQRLPDIDPREVIARNMSDAQTAMADGRYTDPPERSALHYYSTVLALDPTHAEAIAGIDAIAERHLTNARVLLADQRIAEAGVALEKARRVRPDHNGLAVLDAQWRTELRRIIAAATVVATPADETLTLTKPPASKAATASGATRRARQPAASVGEAPRLPAVAAPEVRRPSSAATAPIETKKESIADVSKLAAVLAASGRSSTPAGAGPSPVPESAAPAVDAPITGATVVEDATASVAPPPTAPEQRVEPKLIKVVEPAYPQDALIRGMEGWVDVSLQVSAAGDVIDPRVEATSRGRMFNRAALNAVQQWKYEPRDGDTSERVRVRLQFRQSN